MTKYHRKHDTVIELLDNLTDPNETNNIALEKPSIIDSLMPLLEKGNTGLYDDLK